MKYFEQADDRRQLCRIEDVLPHHAGFLELLAGPVLLRMLATLMGESAVLFKEKINLKLPGGAGFQAHQDAPAFTTFGQTYHVTVLVTVDEADERNGCLEFADPLPVGTLLPQDAGGAVHENKPRPLIQDLDSLPYPDKDLYYGPMPGLAREYMCVASRGCHWACSFCFYTTLYDIYGRNGFVRARSPEHVLGELVEAKEKYDMRYVVFHDDIFPTSLKWLKEFAPLYKEHIGLPFSCITHPQLMREETADLLGEMGCKYVIMGAQTVNESSRSADVINRTESSDEIALAVKRLKKWGIFVLLDHIFGIPGESLDDQEEAEIARGSND